MALHLFLSPHLDDAVLSCGGLIRMLTAQGEQVVILTVFAGDPLDPLPDSPVIQRVLARWRDKMGDAPFGVRRNEDAQAASLLGAKVVHLHYCEAVFRVTKCGAGDWIALYPMEDSLVANGYADGDDARIELLQAHAPVQADVIYAPLCADTHIDHRLVRDWALVLTGAVGSPPLQFYEEFPGARLRQAVNRALTNYRVTMPALVLKPNVNRLNDDALQAKFAAMRAYQSHVRLLGQDAAEFEALARAFMTTHGGGKPAERYWNVAQGEK